jgi:hypothetical protein
VLCQVRKVQPKLFSQKNILCILWHIAFVRKRFIPQCFKFLFCRLICLCVTVATINAAASFRFLSASAPARAVRRIFNGKQWRAVASDKYCLAGA